MSLEADNQIRVSAGPVCFASRRERRPVFLCPRVAIKGGQSRKHISMCLMLNIATTLAETPRALSFDRSYR